MGELHLEIIVDRMKCEYNVETNVASVIKGGSVPGEYIAGVQMGIETVLGLKAILVDGAYHNVDSFVMAFKIAGRAATKEGHRKVKALLMEPLMQVDISTPERYMGDALGDVNSRRGLVGNLGERGNVKTISAINVQIGASN